MGKGRPGVQHGGSAGSFWPSAAKAGKNTGFSAKGTRWDGQLCRASPREPPGQGRPAQTQPSLCLQHWPWAGMGSQPTVTGALGWKPPMSVGQECIPGVGWEF